MAVHRIDIYHCQSCGRVVSCEHEDRHPDCCGSAMEPAVANITYEDDCNNVGSTDDVIRKSHDLEPPVRKQN